LLYVLPFNVQLYRMLNIHELGVSKVSREFIVIS